jgi:hypothetical protein
MLGQPVVDIWDLLSAFCIVIVGVACIVYDRKAMKTI